MAAAACRIVNTIALFAGRNLPVRIVTSQARHLPFALKETARFLKSIRGALKFEPTVVFCFGRIVEIEHEILQWLAWDVREWTPIESPDIRGNRATRRLKMALHTDFHLALWGKPSRIHNATANLRNACPRSSGDADVLSARPMAPLTVDSLRKTTDKDGIAVLGLIGRNSRICIVAKHALIGDQPPCLRMTRIEAGTHGPIPTPL